MRTPLVVRGLLMAALLCTGAGAYAASAPDAALSIQQGQETLQIPAPAGFALLTPNMMPTYGLAQQTVTPSNLLLATLLTQEDAAQASAGKVPRMKRTLSVQASKKLNGQDLTPLQFAMLKSIIRDRQAELIKAVKPDIDQTADRASNAINDQLHAKVKLSIDGTEPLPVHEDTPNSLSWSMYTHLSLGVGNHPDEDRAPTTVVTTANLIYVHNKVLFFYVTGDAHDLDWTRQQSKQWIAQMLADNP